ncbi:hypothetical protein H2248_000053 [Termitomyces sp. 'cryptogamus']|nr:hypothetical protein H2248_000053 [Termitomyces sp. 'cryptogamus']
MTNTDGLNAVETDLPSSLLRYANWRFDQLLNADHWIPASLINAWPWKAKSRLRFSALPSEVLAEILKHVHWHDLLMVRQVCKQLNDVSRTRAVWTSQYQSYLAEKEFRLAAEAPIDMYSSAELESWVLQRRSADKEWEITNPVRERSIFLDYKTYTLTMVPGGRWLLAALSDGSVLCYDLEDPNMRSTVLTPPRDDPNGDLIYDLTVDIDQSNPTLSFCMVNYPSDYFNLAQPVTGSDLTIWRINLRGHGSSAYLEAHFLHSFPATELSTTILSVSLSGDLLARLVYTSQFRSYIEVFDWRASTALVHRRTVIFPKRTERPYSVVLLPGRQLAFVSIRNVTVYDIDIMADDRPIAPIIPQSPSEVRWALFDSDGDFVFQHHQSSLDTKAVTLVLTSNHRMIYHLTIPHNPDSTPHLVHHGKTTQEYCFYTVGREKAFGEKDKSTLVKVGMAHELDLGTTECELNVSRIPKMSLQSQSRYFPPPILSEDIGRIVTKMDSHVFILDTYRSPVM